ncbi:Uncharacterized protein HZ326_14242 [Fusarium oxysporum f. sp. albedinis]|nr:Uncharacterized protein HZ326_14242 [Fusarium oxysporum f. sp. albedinis]
MNEGNEVVPETIGLACTLCRALAREIEWACLFLNRSCAPLFIHLVYMGEDSGDSLMYTMEVPYCSSNVDSS